MSKEVKKAVRKAYAKPRIAIEDFVLNQFIAGSCSVKTRNVDKSVWFAQLDPFTKAAVNAGQFAEPIDCFFNADDDNDTLCYHTQGSPLFTS